VIRLQLHKFCCSGWALLAVVLLSGCRQGTFHRDAVQGAGKKPGKVQTVSDANEKPEKTRTEAKQWLYRVDLDSGEGIIELSDKKGYPRVLFLWFGAHSFEPGSFILEKKEQEGWREIGDRRALVTGKPISIGLFQELRAVPWSVQRSLYVPGEEYRLRVSRSGGVNGMADRDEYWDQIIVVNEPALGTDEMPDLQNFHLIESGVFGDALPPHVKKIHFTPEEIRIQKERMTDPVLDRLSASSGMEYAWEELESLALPLDYQKILLAGINDADPGYACQNGQWFVVWPGSDGSKVRSDWQMRKDCWFAPAIRIGDEIIRPAPLSARTSLLESESGRFLPLLAVEWGYTPPGGDEKRITQHLFSEVVDGIPQVFVHLQLEDPAMEAKLILGHGKRANAYFWGDRSQAHTFIPYFTSRPELNKAGEFVLTDEMGSVVLRSSEPVQILNAGISETLLEFDTENSDVFLSTPQIRTEELSKPLSGNHYEEARKKFVSKWNDLLSGSASAHLPSWEWNRKIDSWLSQVCSISRITLDGKERLSYGSYIYCNYYFGVEEGWSTVALALWGNSEEAKRQAEIILSDENLDKNNYHHQYRNGLSSWYAAMVARLTGDREWLARISPALVSNGNWTIQARKEDGEDRTPLGRGLLPGHVYGGDITTPAYSLYSCGTCIRGLLETSDVFRQSGLDELRQPAEVFLHEAVDFRMRLAEVANGVLDRRSSPPFLPFALEIENKPGNHEGPYVRITDDDLGNYWNLFASLFLHLGIFRYGDTDLPSEWITGFAENHGGLWGGLPRFHSGLDAVYTIGYAHELLERSKMDIHERNKALTVLESYMIHATSHNGNTVQEVSGFFPGRLDWKEYERVVREAPWNFGMYSVESYLEGESPFTEPLGSGAGEGLWLIRKSLIDEVTDERGLPDGRLFLLSSVPGEWLKEGQEIRLTGFPTVYGTIDLRVRSYITSRREIHVSYRFDPVLGRDPVTGEEHMAWYELEKILVRLVPASEDRMRGKKLNAKPPLVLYDEWTLELPVSDKGDFIVKY
jgi:hypothetical protein